MTPDTPSTGPRDQVMLRSAAQHLRDHVDDRWVEVADVVLARAASATRASPPVRAEASSGPFQVAQQVLVSYLRASIDPLDDCEVVDIRVDTRLEREVDDGGEVCTGVLIALTARYGTVLISLADDVREVAAARLEQLLGPVAPPVGVSAMHVHVADVTRGDPKRSVDGRPR